MAGLTQQQLDDLNAVLAADNTMVRVEVRDGSNVYWLCSMTKLDQIDDIISYAALKGIS